MVLDMMEEARCLFKRVWHLFSLSPPPPLSSCILSSPVSEIFKATEGLAQAHLLVFCWDDGAVSFFRSLSCVQFLTSVLKKAAPGLGHRDIVGGGGGGGGGAGHWPEEGRQAGDGDQFLDWSTFQLEVHGRGL